ncbi:MAG: group III truncated hemoglobin [Telluria sp.]
MQFADIDREGIRALVHQFYAKVLADEALAPIFLGAIGDHWDAHLERMVGFWSTVMLGTREFDGNVYGKHMQLGGVAPEHFRRWLAMFEETARELFADAHAEEFLIPARRIAGSLQYGYFGRIEVA